MTQSRSILGEPDTIVAEDVLGFAGIAPPALRVYPVETHIAEKLHAYTMPRSAGRRMGSERLDVDDDGADGRRIDRLRTTTMPRCHELEVALQEIQPRIWRRLLIRTTATFAQLHEAIHDRFEVAAQLNLARARGAW